MTQETIARALGLTFQQVQKYEKGTNRMGASRLQNVATILHVPVSFFFEGQQEAFHNAGREKDAALDFITAFLSSAEGMALVKAFTNIKRLALRRAIVKMVENLSDVVQNHCS